MSAECERVFSSAKLLILDRRNKLDADVVSGYFWGVSICPGNPSMPQGAAHLFLDTSLNGGRQTVARKRFQTFHKYFSSFSYFSYFNHIKPDGCFGQ
jgi:hypothetical protein